VGKIEHDVAKHWRGIAEVAGIIVGLAALSTGFGALALPEEAELFGLGSGAMSVASIVTGAAAGSADAPGCFLIIR
jgi:hypothetical protein